MASRHPRSISIGEYIPLHISTTANNPIANTRVPTTQTSTNPALDYGHGVFVGTLTVNDFGYSSGVPTTPFTLTLFSGNPGTGGTAFASIKPTTNVTLDLNCIIDAQLWYSLVASVAGSGTFSATLGLLPVAV
jgi:hypothetical protein